MPVKTGKDSKGCFARWGSQKKYYYTCGNVQAMARAKSKAAKQGAAVRSTGFNEEDKGEMKKANLRLIKTTDIQEKSETPFLDLTEASIDTDNMIVKGACLFGTRESANDRTYKDAAIAAITALAEGVKCYLNHPTHTETKERDGVRDIRDWAGVYRNPRRTGQKVFADLHCREEYFPLIKDIAELQPANVGNSINARVKSYSDDSGHESVVDVATLRSVDLVSNAATTSTLFESIINKNKEDFEWYIPELLDSVVESKFMVSINKEGVIQDKLKNDEIRRSIYDITYTANSLIEDVLYNKEFSVPEKKKKVISIFNDLDSEVSKKIALIKESINKGGKKMDLTLEALKTENSDLVKAIIDEYKEKEEFQTIKDSVESQKGEIVGLKKTIEDKDKEVEAKDKEISESKKENEELKKKVDDIEVTERKAEKKLIAQELITEVKLPKEAESEIFWEGLMAVQEKKIEDKDGKEILVTVKEQMKKIVDDRLALWNKDTGKVKNSGEEHFDDFKEKDTKEVKKEDLDEAVEKHFG